MAHLKTLGEQQEITAMPHAQDYLANIKQTQLYFCQISVSFCFVHFYVIIGLLLIFDKVKEGIWGGATNIYEKSYRSLI